MQGVSNVMPAVLANAARLAVSAGGAFAAVTLFDAGAAGVFIAIASGFAVYGLLNIGSLIRIPDPEIKNLNPR